MFSVHDKTSLIPGAIYRSLVSFGNVFVKSPPTKGFTLLGGARKNQALKNNLNPVVAKTTHKLLYLYDVQIPNLPGRIFVFWNIDGHGHSLYDLSIHAKRASLPFEKVAPV